MTYVLIQSPPIMTKSPLGKDANSWSSVSRSSEHKVGAYTLMTEILQNFPLRQPTGGRRETNHIHALIRKIVDIDRLTCNHKRCDVTINYPAPHRVYNVLADSFLDGFCTYHGASKAAISITLGDKDMDLQLPLG
ncbi:unnamed protein product [Dracunculus medinensis]|uniref:RNase H domain-containing protein n=1 Tax=Dracunculus medinensis TaxID=318479 RepID=A0A0N4US87_DRAME|nr:unnamed protein product [Dracunculus medinensis]